MDPFVGEIRLFACTYAPRGWQLCAGQILSISQNTALFSLLGTVYGGDGRTTFALPNLQGRVAVSPGQGPGTSNYVQGQVFGTATVSLSPQQMAAHTHTLPCGGTGAVGTLPSSSTYLSAAPGGSGIHPPPGPPLYATPAQQATSSVTMAQSEAGAAGGGQAHNNMSPYLALSYCIALQGIFPSRP